jgi:hypothetical protein
MSIETFEKGLDTLSLDDWMNIDVMAKDEVLAYVRKVWESNEQEALVDDPLFSGPTIDEIVYLVIKSWIELEKYLSNPGKYKPLSAGCNILLTGPRGVGKTTLMKGLTAVIKAKCINVTPIYHDYEQSDKVKPSQLISESINQEMFFKTMDQNAYDAWVKENRKAFIVMGDEINALYEGPDGIPIAKEFLCLGKSRFSMGIISGSTVSVKPLVHKEDSNDPRHTIFPNLNHSVYSERMLKPLRNQVDVDQVLAVKKKILTPANCAVMFRETGGIGRYIDAWCNGSYTSNMVPDILRYYENDPSHPKTSFDPF